MGPPSEALRVADQRELGQAGRRGLPLQPPYPRAAFRDPGLLHAGEHRPLRAALPRRQRTDLRPKASSG
eukprot:10604289-Lingulodinium_polyedra.AAC.1